MNADTPSGADVQASFAVALVDEWVRCGMTDAVLAPGSRSTPLVMALAADARLRLHVVLDERAAGYVALGIALASGRPAVVVTTSGTAAVELHPAIAEASQAGVPLVAVTADRPPELHGVGAPQTFPQEGVYAGATRWAVSPGPPDIAGAASWRSLGARSVAAASNGPLGPGPVHLNLAFREPLLGSPEQVPAGRADGEPWHRSVAAGPARMPPEIADQLASFVGRRGLLVVGPTLDENRETVSALLAAADQLGWPVLADPRSGFRLPAPPVVAAADALLRCPEVAGSPPELVVRVGAPWASKVLNQWLAGIGADVLQILVDPWGRWADPDRRAAVVVGATGHALVDSLARIAEAAPPPGDWYRRWQEAERTAQAVFSAALDPGGRFDLTEPAVARAAVAGAPEGSSLMVSSSMPIRDVEWYGTARWGLAVRSNRGVNGIDGVLSTAIGVALGSDAPTIALVGDLAFLYDTGALLRGADRGVALTVIVVDNDGGGIFSFLPHAQVLEHGSFERYWGTPHGADLAAIASAYGAEVVQVDGRAALDDLVAGSAKPGIRVGIVRTERAANVEVHERLHHAVSAAVAAL